MKRLFSLLFTGASLLAVFAADPGRQAASDPNRDIIIDADQFEYEARLNVATYSGHVRVNDPQMEMQCDFLKVKLPPSGGTVQEILAEGHVVLLNKQDQTRATGAKAVYAAATDLVELTGNPVLETLQGVLTGDVVVFDRAKDRLQARGNVKMKLKPELLKRPNLLAPKSAPAK